MKGCRALTAGSPGFKMTAKLPSEVYMAKTKSVRIEYKDSWIDISVPEASRVVQYGTPRA